MDNNTNTVKDTGKVTASDVMGRLIYYVEINNNGGWFDGQSKDEVKTKADYMGIELDWKRCKDA